MDKMTESWYVAFFDGDIENGYTKACSDKEAVTWFKQKAKDEGCELLEVYQCNDDECLTLKRRVFPQQRYIVFLERRLSGAISLLATDEDDARDKATRMTEKICWISEAVSVSGISQKLHEDTAGERLGEGSK